MITYSALNAQNHELTELTNVLLLLLAERSMCDTDVCCDLFSRYGQRVQNHLDDVDHTYASLLASPDNRTNNIARRFMSGSQEIRKIFSQYSKKWCDKRTHALHIRNHRDFYQETGELFDLVLNRIQDETEQLYPLIREIKGDTHRAA
jgi:hypothetical protein